MRVPEDRSFDSGGAVEHSDVETELRSPLINSWIAHQDLTDGIRVLNRHGLGITQAAGVVVQFRQPEDVSGDAFEVRFAVLNIDLERRRCFPTVVGAKPFLEAGRKQISRSLGTLPERSTEDGHVADSV